MSAKFSHRQLQENLREAIREATIDETFCVYYTQDGVKKKIEFKSEEAFENWHRRHKDSVTITDTKDLDETNIHELSKRLIGNYITKAADQNKRNAVSYFAGAGSKKVHRRLENRNKGIKQAVGRLTREQALDELSKKLLNRYIDRATDDMVHAHWREITSKSRDPKYKKIMNKRSSGIDRAITKYHKEELDELSKKLTANYIRKASDDYATTKGTNINVRATARSLGLKPAQSTTDRLDRTEKNRRQGIARATGRLVREDLSEYAAYTHDHPVMKDMFKQHSARVDKALARFRKGTKAETKKKSMADIASMLQRISNTVLDNK